MKLSTQFTFGKLLRFVFPTVVMMVFTSVSGVIDGIFVVNFAGQPAFAAVNLTIPVVMAFASLGLMFGTGGTALISKTLGEGDRVKAKKIFSLLIYSTVVLGLIMTVTGLFSIRPIAVLMKAESEGILDECVLYGTVTVCGITPFMLQNLFQSFFPLAEKPRTGLIIIVAAGLTNVALDALFVALFNMGLLGAALATVTSQAVGGIAPIIYFAVKRNGTLCLGAPALEIKPLLKAAANGSSEMMTNLSLSFVNILYNIQLMNFVGKDGVSAYGVLMYVYFIFCSIFIGYSIGVAPVIGYNFGARNREQLNGVLKKSIIIIAIGSVAMFAAVLSLNYPLTYIFVGADKELLALTRRGFIICSSIFLVMGFNIFGSAFFTALNNGAVSAVLSFLRTLVLQIICVTVLPLFWKLDGVWASNVFAELLALVATFTFFMVLRKKYGYFIKNQV